MIYNLGLFSDVGNAIVQALRTFGGYIAATIYELVAYMYDIFVLLGTAEILDNDIVNAIYRKVGLILGLFMLFKLVFSLIQSLVEPNNLTDNKKGPGALIKRLVIAIVLLGITPFLFREAFKLQRLLIGADDSSNNVLYKLIVGNTTGVNVNNFGRELSANMFFTFYTDWESPKYNNGKDEYDEQLEERYQEVNYNSLVENVTKGSSFFDTVSPLSFKSGGVYVIEFNFLLILIVGVILLYIIFMFCFQTASRVFQLAFLQLIAPIPILSYISDPDGTFKKWIQKCLWTFLDLFIRLSIIYFVIFLSSYVFDQFADAGSIFAESVGLSSLSWYTQMLLKAFLIFGLFMFANNVPNLLKEIFPAMGGDFKLGLNAKKDVIDPIKSAYKSTPLGWAPRALGFAGRKAIGYADRKMHHAPKPRGKFGQYIDKLAPETAKVIQEKRQAKHQAKLDLNEWKKDENFGQRIYDKAKSIDGKADLAGADGKVKNGIFDSKEYIDSWNKRNEAKGKVKEATDIVDKLQREVNSVYNNSSLSDVERKRAIEVAEQKLKNAKSNLSAAEGEFKIADERHKKNQAIYTNDAKKENAFNRYADMHKSTKDINYDVDKIQRKYDAEKAVINDEVSRRRQAQEHAASSQQFYNDLSGVKRSSASDNGAPTEAFSAIAEKYKQEDEQVQAEIQRRAEQQRMADEAQKQFNRLNNVGGSSASQNGAPTAENSLLAQLSEQAHQQEMQREFMNRNSNDSNNNSTQ